LILPIITEPLRLGIITNPMCHTIITPLRIVIITALNLSIINCS